MKIIRKPSDSDLSYAMESNPQEFNEADVKNVLAQVPGEADGFDWHWIIELNDGRFAYVYGCCDYTGWDCQSNLHSEFSTTARKAAMLAKPDEYEETKKPIQQQLLDQLKGKQPYGLREQ